MPASDVVPCTIKTAARRGELILAVLSIVKEDIVFTEGID
ncbi:hypothetical protein SPWS13_3933 [Shewanella putrefaciens]|nr:hypothetical protein SPWS13_3933 [Shewanella putrefaciens]